MRALLGLLCLSVLGTALSHAQTCIDSTKMRTISCYGANGCHQTITIEQPVSGNQSEYRATSVSCCGELHSDVEIIGACEFALSNELKQEIDKYSGRSTILVATCRGHYVPYEKMVTP